MEKISWALTLCYLLPGLSQAAVIYQHNDNQLDLYGVITGTGYISDNSKIQGDHSFVRTGIKVNSKIFARVSGYGRWEYQVNVNQPETGHKSFSRFGYAGLDFNQWGTVDYGRNNGILFDITGWTNGYWTGNLPAMGLDGYEAQDNFMVKRSNNLLTWRNHYPDSGLVIGLQYQGKNSGWNDSEHQLPRSNNLRGVAKQNGDGYGIAVSYRLPFAVSVGAAYARSTRTTEQRTDGSGTTANAWNAGIKYDQNPVYLAATYSSTSNMSWFKNAFIHHLDNYELVAQYKFTNGFQPLIAYTHARAKTLARLDGADVVHYVDLGLNYVFNKNFSVYAHYKLNLIKRDNLQAADSANVIAFGVSYKF